MFLQLPLPPSLCPPACTLLCWNQVMKGKLKEYQLEKAFWTIWNIIERQNWSHVRPTQRISIFKNILENLAHSIGKGWISVLSDETKASAQSFAVFYLIRIPSYRSFGGWDLAGCAVQHSDSNSLKVRPLCLSQSWRWEANKIMLVDSPRNCTSL